MLNITIISHYSLATWKLLGVVMLDVVTLYGLHVSFEIWINIAFTVSHVFGTLHLFRERCQCTRNAVSQWENETLQRCKAVLATIPSWQTLFQLSFLQRFGMNTKCTFCSLCSNKLELYAVGNKEPLASTKLLAKQS
jgi:hypothetical protein